MCISSSNLGVGPLEKLFSISISPIGLHSSIRTGLGMVGPWDDVWKVLRETDGERFVRAE